MITDGNEAIRSKIRTAAEILFATQGYEGTSLRMITRSAKVNLAAVNYHFNDKVGLFTDVFSRRVNALSDARLVRLKEAQERAGDSPMPLRAILDALVAPMFELAQDTVHGGQFAVRIIGRSLTEPQPFMTALLAKEFHPVMIRFAQAMRRQMPDLPPEDFLWRLSFVVGAMHHTLATIHQMKELTSGVCRSDDHAGALRRFLDFGVCALSTPANRIDRE
ncbi:MAG TPA: TetR family transcriptional regulator [Planctomycetota bacterium]|jgi:AcrR family transcriptional regulator|nr:TetR family transcriptional regulator [Planctomycetota bacterium]